MLSSTSNSDSVSTESGAGKRWLMTWLIALSLVAMTLGAVEYHWRGRDYRPTILDSTLLWSVQRDRVYAQSRTPLLLLGASRIEFGVDMKVMRELLPRYLPIMLAVNARYPLGTLRDLAKDENFRGIVVCDVDSFGLLRELFEMQREYVRYYHQQWTPNWHLHRLLLNRWQAHALIADPVFSIVASARRWLDSAGEPFHNYINFHADRSGDLDFSRTDAEAIKRHFADTLEGNVAGMPKRTADEWLADLAPVGEWAKRIEARGGHVIFFQSAVHGLQQTAIDHVMPRALYWDRFASTVAIALSGTDEPSLNAFPLPDDSHLDYHDKPAYTRALVDVLVAHGWLQR